MPIDSDFSAYADEIVEPPLKTDDASRLEWHDEADIVVVGFGAAGSVASIEAREGGAEVLVVDRFGGGGAAAYSGGTVYGGGTKFQRQAGVDDNAEEMFKYLSIEVGDAVSSETLRRFCDQSAGNMEWLEAHGVPFEGSIQTTSTAAAGKEAVVTRHGYLYYSGNEAVPAYAAIARPAPRGHRTKGKGAWTGKHFFSALKTSAMSSGVRLKLHSRALRLVVDASDTVIGIEILEVPERRHATHQKFYNIVRPARPFNHRRSMRAIEAARRLEVTAGVRRLIRARRGVILASGGFSYNLGLLRRFLPKVTRYYTSLMKHAAIGCDGSGILLGASAGGRMGCMENSLVGRLLSPPYASIEGLLVNNRGERFINEDAYLAFLGKAIIDQPDSAAWLIVDNPTFWKIVRGSLPNAHGTFKYYGIPSLLNMMFGGMKKAPTIAALARKCGLPEGALEQVVEEVRGAAAAETPDRVGKNQKYLHGFDKGPYRALNNSINNSLIFPAFFTLGGLQVNEVNGAVVREDGQDIAGLFAAGRTAVGVCSNGYFSGMSLADSVFSGRRAARAALGRPRA